MIEVKCKILKYKSRHSDIYVTQLKNSAQKRGNDCNVIKSHVLQILSKEEEEEMRQNYYLSIVTKNYLIQIRVKFPSL